MFALAVSGALVWSGLSCWQASRPGQPLIFMAVRRPVISGSLTCNLVCSLINGLSVWSNYPRPQRKADDFVDCHIHTKVFTADVFKRFLCIFFFFAKYAVRNMYSIAIKK